MVVLAQLVRASDCGSEGRGFEPHTPPFTKTTPDKQRLSGVSLYQKKRLSEKGSLFFMLQFL